MCPPTTCITERSASCQALNLSCLPRRRPLAMATFRRSATRGCEVIRCTARGASAPTRLRPSLVFLHRLCCYGRSGGSLARAKGATIWRSIRTSRTLSGDAFSLGRARRPATNAGVGRSTAYPWSRARFSALREQGLGVRTAAQELRVAQAGAWEAEPRREAVRACGAPRAVLVTRSGLRRAEPGGSRSRHQEAEGDRTDQASTTASCGPIRRSGPRTPLDGQLQAAAARKAPDSAERTEQAPF